MPPSLGRLSSVCFIYITSMILVLGTTSGQTTETKSSFARTSLKYDAPAGKVAVTPEISVEDLEKIVEVHNRLRRQQGAADMHLLKWHSYLATLAEEWVDRCNWRHGQIYQDPNVRSFEAVGQSMYASRSDDVQPEDVVRQWFGQEVNFDRQSLTCRSGDDCQLYTQVVWAASREIGCAYRLCSELDGLDWENATFFICNYAPSGSWSQEAPFRTGKECTKCLSGGRWCEKGLCNSFCEESGLKCYCNAECACGRLDRVTCSCKCGIGWYGPDCSDQCVDQDPKCSSDPAWSLSPCSEEDDLGRVVRSTCPATCRLCQAANSSFPAECPSASQRPDAEMSGVHQHLFLPILLIWTFAATWMLAVPWINWNCSCQNHRRPVSAAEQSSNRNRGSSGCSANQRDLCLS